MIGKIIAGSSFAGTVGYVMKEQSRILAAEGITLPDVREMVQDFKDQTLLNPRIKNAVGHISLSFSAKDGVRMIDALMLDIAQEYMQRMGITDTQYLLVRHLDQPHPHCHLVYNRVGNNGQTISDRNIKIRNAKVCRVLTEKYGLHLAPGKESVRRERLREPDKTKYEIYDAIKANLPNCSNWIDLELRLKERGISMRYKYCGSTNQKQGVLFSKNGFEFSGSKIDRQFSYSKLNRHFTQAQQQTRHRTTLAKEFHAAIGNYRSAFTDLFGNMGGGGNKGQADAGSINFGGNIGALPLPPNDSPVGLSADQLQRKPGESPEEHIARITALLNTVAEAMAVATMEQKRKLRDRKANKPKMKL
ncbi:relaxase/mobilization nuclease domain-containing protein [uncultured Alistipes sp.]|uniref:relaxase/mobilization nuclease domain-containing protein n=1 Tax=uncultured Alistipes sp. TaxID=538949 RepID=UPI0025966E69|nr:relaxase/mobilization nuclease domain-containing protein [uncultured Alistipes sp.]